jgi:hypothetical protein
MGLQRLAQKLATWVLPMELLVRQDMVKLAIIAMLIAP